MSGSSGFNYSAATAQRAWDRLVGHGSASTNVASVMAVGLDDYLNLFTDRFLGDSARDAFKVVLGLNGEGKTHFLHCVEARALEKQHLVAFVEAKNAGAAESSFAFGREVLQALSIGTQLDAADELPLLRLLRAAVDRKRDSLSADGLDADSLLPEWADGMRSKNLQPLKLAQSLSEAIHGVIQGDLDRAVANLQEFSLEGLQPTKSDQVVLGPKLLRSIARLPDLLGFRRLVLLVDEAEVAFDGLAQKRRQTLLSFFRFLNDHLSGSDAGAIILIACTDDFWPARFNEYAALKARVTDPGLDRVEDRRGLSVSALVNKNKLWVRETFQGTLDNYTALGDAILVLGKRVLPALEVGLQTANAKVLAGVASSEEVNKVVKRPFVKALAQLVQDQVDDDQQRLLTDDEARGRFDLARRAIQQIDQREEPPPRG